MRALIAASLLALLAGCAATVKKGEGPELALPMESRSSLVVSFDGTDRVLAHPDWSRFKGVWRSALQAESAAAGYKLIEASRQSPGNNANGVALDVYVSNFRYLTTGQRYALGVMVGNAWVESKVSFVDINSGQTYGSRTYNTSSSAWEGVLSAMTDEQLRAISKEIVAEIKGARVIPLPAQSARASPGNQSEQAPKEQQLRELSQQKLPYEEYQKRYKQIMSE